MAMLAACTGKNASHALDMFGAGKGQDNSATPAIKPLDTRLVGAHATDRISLPGFDDKQPARGNHFVVLDVAVRNTDTQPRVFSEGQIIAANGSRERTYPTPVNIFADGYLQLQVLPPSAAARGKIVYEVPDDANGVLYWVPGGATERILLHPDVMAVTAATRSRPPPSNPAAALQPPTLATSQPVPARQVDAPPGASAAGTVATATPAAADRAPPPGQGSMTTPVNSQSTREVSMGGAQARELACSALRSRNDPGEKKRYLGFFKRECSGYAMPSAWSAGQVANAAPIAKAQTIAKAPTPAKTLAPARSPAIARAAPAPDPNRWPPRSGPAFDCEQAFSPAEQLICKDAVLSLMDWELTRAYANAQRSVDDPAALQREQDEWRWHVRNACRTVSCVESVYTERTADLTALGRPR